MLRPGLARQSAVASLIALSIGSAPAQAAEGLSCLDTPFAPEAEAVIEDYRQAIDIDFVQRPIVPDKVKIILATRLTECRDSQGWSSEAYAQASYFYGPHFLVRLLRTKIPLKTEQLEQLDARFEAADKDRLPRGLLGANEEDKAYLTQLARLDGTEDLYETGMWIGALITAMVTRDKAKRAFLAS